MVPVPWVLWAVPLELCWAAAQAWHPADAIGNDIPNKLTHMKA